MAALEKEAELGGVLSFIQYLCVLHHTISNMCRRLGDARGGLSAEREFADERDEGSLLSLTDTVEWLRDLASKKRHAVEMSIKLEKSMLSVVRTHLFGGRETTLMWFEGELGIAKANAAAARGDDGTNGDKGKHKGIGLQQSDVPFRKTRIGRGGAGYAARKFGSRSTAYIFGWHTCGQEKR